MSIFRTIAMFLYLFWIHDRPLQYPPPGRARAGRRRHGHGGADRQQAHPHWSRQILHITGVQLLVEGLDNIPKDTACVFVGNHRSYYDIPCCWPGWTGPTASWPRRSWRRFPCSTAG